MSETAPHRIPSFRAQLARRLGGVALVVLVGVGSLVGWLLLRATATASGEAMYSTAQAAADLLATDLREREAEIHLLSRSSLLRQAPLDDPEIGRLLSEHKRVHEEHAWIGVADSAGMVRSASDALLVGASVGERPWFRAGSSRLFVGDVHKAQLLATVLPKPADGSVPRFVDFAAPVRDEQGRLRGVVGSHVDWRWVVKVLDQLRQRYGLADSVEILVLDQRGDVLFPPQRVGERELLPPQDERRAAIARWSDGEDYLGSVVDMRSGGADELGWRVVVRQLKTAALAPVYEQLALLLLLGLLVAMSCALAAYVLADRMSVPLRRLVDVAQRMAAGDRDADFGTHDGTRELHALSASLRSMTAVLRAKEADLAATNAGLEAAVRMRTEELELANAELERLATRDPLTGVFNRRWFDARLLECLASAQRAGRPFALLIVDVDHFKRINDEHGHAVGDAVLRMLAHLFQAHTRSTDFVARIGGEEFAILMPDIEHVDDARVVAVKLRAAVVLAEFPSVGRVTVSGGIAMSAAGELGAAGAETLMARADAALYSAKANGRDRIEFNSIA